MNNRYYLLTGAAGFLGTNICMQLLEAGCKVRALDLANEQLREGGFDVKEAYRGVEDSVVDTYQKIEDGVVGGYQKIEDSAVNGFRKVSDFFIRTFFSRKGETVEQTRKRLSRK